MQLGHNLDFSDYVSADDDLETSEPLTDDAIIGIVQQPTDSETESDDEHITPSERPSHLLAIDACHQLRLYLGSQPETRNLFSCLNSIEEFVREDNGSISNSLLSRSLQLPVILNESLELLEFRFKIEFLLYLDSRF